MDSREKYMPVPVEEERPALDLRTVEMMGVLAVALFSLMVLGAVKFGELVLRVAMRWW